MKEVTPISHEAALLPDPAAQTELLRAALDEAIGQLQQMDSPQGEPIVQELLSLRASLAPPPEGYPMLSELDGALGEAIRSLPALFAGAEPPEMQQTLKTLRRIALSDRRRIDPDPQRHRTDLAIAIRRAWLISHRAGLLKASGQLLTLSRQLDVSADSAERARLKEAIDVLTQYVGAQEGYGASVRRELDDLTARRLLC